MDYLFNTDSSKTFAEGAKRFGINFGIGFLMFFLTTFFYLCLKPYANAVEGNGQTIAVAFGFSLLILIFLYGFVLFKLHRLNQKWIFFFIVLISWVFSLTYACYNLSTDRQHDVWNANEHSDYAWNIYEYGALPSTNEGQFYHPPLNALVQAMWMHILDFFVNLFRMKDCAITRFQAGIYRNYDAYRYFLFGSTAILAVFYRFLEAIFFIKILTLYKEEGKEVTLLACLACFYPRLTEFSGLLNNDPIAFLLSTMALYYALRYIKKGKDWYSIMMCAVTLGLAMMAKLNSAVICLPIGFLFVYEFVLSCQKKEGSQKLLVMVMQYLSFLVVCGVLALWFQVYASKRFNQPFGYVWGQDGGLNRNLYVGNYNLIERFFLPSFKELTKSVFGDPFNSHNLWACLMKSSIFDEVFYNSQNLAAGLIGEILLFFVLVVHFVLFVRFAYLTIRYDWVKKGHKRPTCYDKMEDNIFLLLLFLAEFGADIYFNIKMPYGCTMDFRYVMPLIIAYPLSYLFYFDRSSDEKIPFFRILMKVEEYMIVGFLVFTSLYYMS